MVEELGEEAVDVAIIGGGAAGLSAALTLVRARRTVLVVDEGQPRNAPARAAHGLLGLEGINPLELLKRGRAEVMSYGARITTGQVAHAARDGDGDGDGDGEGFRVRLVDGSSVRAGQLVVATGVVDELPEVPGLRERWGRDVVHCPYCHGWEIRDERVGLLATGPMSAMQALLFSQWTDRLWFFPQDVEVSDNDRALLAAAGVTVVDERVSGLQLSDADHLIGVGLADGTGIDLDALAVPARTRVRLAGLETLHLETVTNAAGTSLVVDTAGLTNVPGVWAAGNAVNSGMQISEAAANGARVAMTLNTDLALSGAQRRKESA